MNDFATTRNPARRSKSAACPERNRMASPSKGQLLTRYCVRGFNGLCSKMNKAPPGFSARRHSFSNGSRMPGGTWCITQQNTITSNESAAKGTCWPS